MKKFNSILVIAAALTSVFGFTSCDKADEPFVEPEPIPQITEDAYLYVPVTEAQLKYIDATYTISMFGENKVIKLSEMTEVTDEQSVKGKESMLYMYNFNKKSDSSPAKIYEYNLGKTIGAKLVSIKYTALTPMTDEGIDFIEGAKISSGVKTLSETKSYNYHNGLKEIESVMGIVNQYISNFN